MNNEKMTIRSPGTGERSTGARFAAVAPGGKIVAVGSTPMRAASAGIALICTTVGVQAIFPASVLEIVLTCQDVGEIFSGGSLQTVGGTVYQADRPLFDR